MFSKVHVSLYKLTGGRIGGRIRRAPVLLLTTGRKSLRERTIPPLYLEDHENLVVVASYGGRDKDPAWYLNLRHNPEARIRIRRETRMVKAKVATPSEKDRLWPLVTGIYPQYEEYQRKTKREIPLVILAPMENAHAEADQAA